MDNDFVLERAVETYDKIYASRRNSLGFRKSEYTQKVAIAFAITNTLIRNNMPRPIDYILTVCELESRRPLLHLKEYLHLSEKELEHLRKEDYELQDDNPEDYVDIVCAHLNIPFHVASKACALIASVRWHVSDRSPTVLVAAAIQAVLTEEQGVVPAETLASVCALLDVKQRSVTEVRKIILSVAEKIR